MTELHGKKKLPATREFLGLKDSAWEEAKGTKNQPTTRESPSLYPECDGGEVFLCRKYFFELPSLCSCRAGRTLPVTVVSFPPFSGAAGALPVTVVSFPLLLACQEV